MTAVEETVDHERLVRLLYRFSGAVAAADELDEVIAALGEEARHIMRVDGAGVMLADEAGDLHFASSSDPELQALEALQLEFDEGPCLLAYRTGEHVLAPDLVADERFPHFGQAASDAGLLAVYSFPMRSDEAVVGALNFYSGTVGRLSPRQVETGFLLADVATVHIGNQRLRDALEIETSQLRQALGSRVLVEQAKGFLAAALAVSVEDAFQLLRSHARSNNVRLAELAQQVIDGRLRPEALRPS